MKRIRRCHLQISEWCKFTDAINNIINDAVDDVIDDIGEIDL